MVYESCTPAGGEFAAKLIEKHVRSLRRQSWLWGLWPEDVRQELWLEVGRKWEQYDPRKGSEKAYLRAVINNKLSKLREQARAQCRDYRLRACSLDEPAEDEDGYESTVGETTDLCTWLAVLGLGCAAKALTVELKLDLQQALRELDEQERALCLALMELSISQIARRWGMKRATLYALLGRIRRKVFGALGDWEPKNFRQFARRSGKRGVG